MQNPIDKQSTWTTQQMVNLSQNLAIAFNPGMADTDPVSSDSWTTEKLVQLSNSMAQAYFPQ